MRLEIWLFLLIISLFAFASCSSSDDDSSSSSADNSYSSSEESNLSSVEPVSDVSLMSLTEDISDAEKDGIDHFSDSDSDDLSIMEVTLPHVDFDKKFESSKTFDLPLIDGSLAPADILMFQQNFEKSRPEDDPIGGLIKRMGVGNIISSVVRKDEDYFNFEVVLPKEFTPSNQYQSFCCSLFPILAFARLRLAEQ